MHKFGGLGFLWFGPSHKSQDKMEKNHDISFFRSSYCYIYTILRYEANLNVIIFICITIILFYLLISFTPGLNCRVYIQLHPISIKLWINSFDMQVFWILHSNSTLINTWICENKILIFVKIFLFAL